MNRGRTRINERKDKDIDDYAKDLKPRDDIDFMFLEKKVEEESPTLGTA